MSADLNTCITMRGTREELLSMLKVLQLFETEKLQQYRKKKDCGYIELVRVRGESGEIRTDGTSEQELIKFLSNAGNELFIDAGGPWGSFCEPGEVGLFETLSEAAPSAFFDGNINGFVTGADVSHTGKLIDGKLHLTDYYVADETFPELYIEEVKKKLSYSKFCKLFKVDKEEFEPEYYCDFIMEASEEGFPNEIDYDTFMEYCDCAEIDEEQFENALEKIAKLGIVDFETFRETINEDDFSKKSVYDPVAKVYEGRNLCEGLTFVITGKVSEFKNREALSEYIMWQGGKVTGSVSKNTTYLVNNDSASESSKNKKAKELGIEIITEVEFINMFGKA